MFQQLIDSGKIVEVGVPNPRNEDELVNMLIFEASHADIVEHGESETFNHRIAL